MNHILAHPLPSGRVRLQS